LPPAQTITASFASFDEFNSGSTPVDPRSFLLPDDSGYEEGRPIRWAPAWDLLAEAPAWVPLDLAISPPREGLLHEVCTNGLASGNTQLEAVVHGLAEVIERDATSQLLFAREMGEPGAGPALVEIDRETIPEALRAKVEGIEGEEVRVRLAWLMSETKIPVVRARLFEGALFEGSGAPRRHVGYGCDPSAEVALDRALNEAAQARLMAIQGARDSYNRARIRPEQGRGAAERRSTSFSELPTNESPDLFEDLQALLAGLRRAGFSSALAVDLTRADLGLPVVRVLVPGLACFQVNRRRVGWRCLRWLL
jgi:ribosomal protein S12 methylthiotransferase accessory factor